MRKFLMHTNLPIHILEVMYFNLHNSIYDFFRSVLCYQWVVVICILHFVHCRMNQYQTCIEHFAYGVEYLVANYQSLGIYLPTIFGIRNGLGMLRSQYVSAILFTIN